MDKNKFIDCKKKEAEIEIMNNCTFKPKRKKKLPSEKNVIVKGADRFYELRNMAKKQQYDKEEREKKVLYKDYIRDSLF